MELSCKPLAAFKLYEQDLSSLIHAYRTNMSTSKALDAQ